MLNDRGGQATSFAKIFSLKTTTTKRGKINLKTFLFVMLTKQMYITQWTSEKFIKGDYHLDAYFYSEIKEILHIIDCGICKKSGKCYFLGDQRLIKGFRHSLRPGIFFLLSFINTLSLTRLQHGLLFSTEANE